MARMDLKPRRDAPGMSVFWMILIVGAGVFVLMAIVLMSADGDVAVEPEPQQIIAGEGDEVPGAGSFGADEVADEAPQEPGELPGEAGELDEGVVLSPTPTGDTQELGTVGAVDVDAAEEAVEDEAEVEADSPDEAEAEVVEEEADAEEADPLEDVDLTPSGPEGRDEEVILDEVEEIDE